MKISELLQLEQSSDCDITGLALDSRLVKPGYAFFALQGTVTDGRNYIDEAVQNGAAAIIADAKPHKNHSKPVIIKPVIIYPKLREDLSRIAARFYDDPAKKLQIVGVTGTNGKTSCTHFIAGALQKLNIPCGIIGTLGIGTYGHVQADTHTLTLPDAITLQQTFARFRDQGLTHVAMEVSSHGLDQGRVNDVPFTVGMFTNLTRDHLDYHGTMEAYGNAKKKLFTHPLLQSSVVNGDDAFGREIIADLKNPYIYTINDKSGGDFVISAHDVRCDDHGMMAKIISPWGVSELRSTLIGQFNLSNLLGVLTTLCLLKVDFQDALKSLSTLTPVAGRMERFGGQTKPLVIVDYSHTPDSLEKALKTLQEHCQGKLYCVFGCGGDRDRGKRPIMAAIAEKYADSIIVTDDNPRTEDPEMITHEIFQGFSQPNKAMLQHDRSKAIQNVIQYAKPGDCILIAGKGAEMYQLINDQKIPFSDAKEVVFALGE
jgi:UDP-N-acetylmuramoyl-L-alanyl-D-glutamate--2,6-diaminopimelate ligase